MWKDAKKEKKWKRKLLPGKSDLESGKIGKISGREPVRKLIGEKEVKKARKW